MMRSLINKAGFVPYVDENVVGKIIYLSITVINLVRTEGFFVRNVIKA